MAKKGVFGHIQKIVAEKSDTFQTFLGIEITYS